MLGAGFLLLPALCLVGPAVSPALAGATALDLHHQVLAARAAGDLPLALERLDALERVDPSFYAANGHAYLAGIIFTELGNTTLAERRFGQVVADAGPLADRAALRLARHRLHSNPREALRLVEGFTRRYPASGVLREARLLEVELAFRVGEAERARRLIRSLPAGAEREAEWRLFAVAREQGPSSEARDRARRLLARRTTDAAAGEAASYLTASGARGLDSGERFELAGALFVQRRFAAAIDQLEAVIRDGRDPRLRDEARYLLGRAATRAGDECRALAAWEALAAGAGPWRERALYQLARHALSCGEAEEARERFREVAVSAPASSPAFGDALLKLTRLAAADGDRREADRWLAVILGHFGEGAELSLAAGFEVVGAELAAGELESALARLEGLRPSQPAGVRALGYWRGIVLAALGRFREAGEAYTESARGHDLTSALALGRLAALPASVRPDLEPLLARARCALAGADGERARSSALAALDGGAVGAERAEASALLRESVKLIPDYRAAFELELGPAREPRTMPAAASALAASEDLRFLGLDAEAADALRAAGGSGRDLESAFAVAELARRGGDARTALLHADRLLRRLPAEFRREALPDPIHDLLYPDPYRAEVERAARAHGVDPDLLRAIMREESHFDAGALSAAGARGLMQFIPETARRVGLQIGLGRVEAAAIHEPAVAIPLGAAYVAELLRLFDGKEGVAVAAYNAGEEVAAQWLSRTRHGGLDEFLREIEYDETRAYVDRVLTSFAAYRGRSAGTPIELD